MHSRGRMRSPAGQRNERFSCPSLLGGPLLSVCWHSEVGRQHVNCQTGSVDARRSPLRWRGRCQICVMGTVQVYEISLPTVHHTGTLLAARLLPRPTGPQIQYTFRFQAPGPAVTVSPIRNCNANALLSGGVFVALPAICTILLRCFACFRC